jgi:hydrophobe/amphiphile efflux-3 (HAE3) family protein
MYSSIDKLIKKVQSLPRLTVVLVGVLTIIFAFFAITQLEFSANYSDMIAPSGGEYDISSPENTEFSSEYTIMVTRDNLFDPVFLETLYTAVEQMKDHPSVGSATSIFDFTTIEKKGTRIVSVPMLDKSTDLIWDDQRASAFEQRVKQDDIVKGLLVSDTYTSFLFQFGAKPDDVGVLDDFNEIFSGVAAMATISVSGDLPIAKRIMGYLSKDLITLLSLSFLVILAVYYLSFKAKRASVIPFTLSVIGIVWTFGAMALLGFKLTVVNIVTPVLVLTIGSSYSIHVLTEYFQSYHEGNKNYIYKAVSKIGRTIILACITDIIGFLSLLSARTNAFKEFGVSVSIGITFCALLSVTYLPAILTITIAPRKQHMVQYTQGIIASISRKISRVVMKRWKAFLIVAFVIVIGFFLTKDHVGLQTNYMTYFPRKEPLIIDSMQIVKEFKGVHSHYITLTAPEGEKNYFLEPENLEKVHAFETKVLENSPDISHVLSYSEYVAFMNKVYTGTSEIPESSGMINLLSRFMKILTQDNQDSDQLKMLINDDGTEMTIILKAWDAEEQDLQTVASATRINKSINDLLYLLPQDVEPHIWGDGSDAILFSDTITTDQIKATFISFILVFLLSTISFKSFKFGIYSIIPIVVGIMVNYIFMFLTGIPFDIITIGFSSVTIGVGIDDAIHFLIRYKNKVIINKYHNVRLRLRETIHETSRPILLTTAAIVLGISMLSFGSYVPIKYFGILVSISLLNTMLATLFILPPVILITETFHTKLIQKKS